MKAIKVCELNKYIKKYMAMDYLLNDLLVQGEVSNLTKHSNGNIYLTLKDEKASIDAIIYSKEAREIKFELKEGDNVEVKASASIYEKNARLNLYIREIKLQGMGELYEKFLYLKDSLDNEGLFSQDHKKTIPYYPKTIGLITSPNGAAIKDFLSILKRRNNSIDVIVYPVNVQGINARDDILQALEYFAENETDVVVLTRGGGSLEDLFVFNDETLARAIYDFKTPIISAIGHEIDYVISDFVSDLRAATPSAAAELVTMSKLDLNNSLFLISSRATSIIDEKLNSKKENLVKNFIRLNDSLLEKINDSYKDLERINRRLTSNKPNLNKERLSLEKNLLAIQQKLSLDISKNRIKLDGAKTDLEKLRVFENKSRQLSMLEKDLLKVDILNKIALKRDNIKFLKKKLDYAMSDLFSKNKKELLNLNESIMNFRIDNMISIETEKGKSIISAKSLDIGDKLKLKFKDGNAKVIVKDVELRS